MIYLVHVMANDQQNADQFVSGRITSAQLESLKVLSIRTEHTISWHLRKAIQAYLGRNIKVPRQ